MKYDYLFSQFGYEFKITPNWGGQVLRGQKDCKHAAISQADARFDYMTYPAVLSFAVYDSENGHTWTQPICLYCIIEAATAIADKLQPPPPCKPATSKIESVQATRLYAFQPKGHGQFSYFVLAESERDAIEAVKNKIEQLRKECNGHSDALSWLSQSVTGFGTPDYECKVLTKGEVITQDND